MSILVLSSRKPRYVIIEAKKTSEITRISPVNIRLNSIHSFSYEDWTRKYEEDLDLMCESIKNALQYESDHQGYLLSMNPTFLFNEVTRYLYTCSTNVNKRY